MLIKKCVLQAGNLLFNGTIKEKLENNQSFDKIEVKTLSIKDCRDKMIKHHPQRLFLETDCFYNVQNIDDKRCVTQFIITMH